MSSRRTKTAKVNKRQEKLQSQAKCQERGKKSSEEQETLKINTEAQKSKKNSNSRQTLKISTKAQIQYSF
jgi:hypothetical protein